METNKSEDRAMEFNNDLNSQTFYHSTKANLKISNLIEIGFNLNYGNKKRAKYILYDSPLGGVIWGTELALTKNVKRSLW